MISLFFNIEYLATFFLSLAFILLIIKIAPKIHLLDFPKNRSIHKETVPRGAGIGFILAYLISLLFFEFQLVVEHHYIFIAILIVYLLGTYDDFKDIRARIKFIGIFLSASLLIVEGVYIESLGSYLGLEIHLGYLAIPFSLLAITGFTNGLNLIDGLDGLAGGVSIIMLLTFAYIGQVFGDDLILGLSTFAIVTLIPFMIFNWSPAKIFMGDSGSLSLGFVLSIIAILSLKYVHPVILPYLLALPLVDTVIVMIRRMLTKHSPFKADTTHLHHILCGFFKSTPTTVLFLIMSQLLFCFLGYVVIRHIITYPLGLFPVAMVISYMILMVMAYMILTAMLNILKNKS